MNVTAVSPSAPGHLTVFPCGTEMPLTSTLNYGPGEVVANAAVTKIGTDGKVCINTHAASDIVVDVTGYIPAGSLFSTVVPGRLLDTRSGPDYLTIDGSFQGIGRRSAGTTLELTVTGRMLSPNPENGCPTILPGLSILPGSNIRLTSANTLYSEPYCRLRNHVRLKPSPCIPLTVPLFSKTCSKS